MPVAKVDVSEVIGTEIYLTRGSDRGEIQEEEERTFSDLQRTTALRIADYVVGFDNRDRHAV